MRIFIFPAVFIISVIFLIPTSWAQEDAGITILTKPPGATVYLRGDQDLVANTPARIPSDISGRYRAEITRPGYETWKGDLTFIPGSANNIEIRLSRKTRFKAALRSLFIPGWGQVYSENKTRGYLITSGVLASAATLYYLDRRFNNKQSDYDLALAEYNAAARIDEKIALKTFLDDKQNDAYKAETDRNTALALGIALWGYNVLDALLFFPGDRAYYPSVTSLGDGLELSYRLEF
jgi:hypothetical protein